MVAFMSAGPLDGYRVIDLTQVRAGPTCTRQLADLGADVIWVGSPTRQTLAGSDGYNLTRNKRSILIDLASPSGRDTFLRLCRERGRSGRELSTERQDACRNRTEGRLGNLGGDCVCQHLWIRRVRPICGAPRRRSDCAGDERPHERHRTRRHRPVAGGNRDIRHGCWNLPHPGNSCCLTCP